MDLKKAEWTALLNQVILYSHFIKLFIIMHFYFYCLVLWLVLIILVIYSYLCSEILFL